MSKVIFIVGAPRSGTTLVYGMLVNNQEHIGGSFQESKFYSHFMNKPYSMNLYQNNEYFKSLFSKKEIEAIFQKATTHIDFFKKSIKYFLKRENKQIFVEKSPPHTLYIHKIIQDFDNPVIVLIERNPEAIINSMVKTKWTTLYSDKLPGKLKQLRLFKYFSAFAKYYRYSREFDNIKAYHNSISISYEDLVLDKIDLKSMLHDKLQTGLNKLYIAPPYSAEVDHHRNKLDKSRIEGYKKSMPLWAQKVSSILFSPQSIVDSIIGFVFCTLIFEPVSRVLNTRY